MLELIEKARQDMIRDRAAYDRCDPCDYNVLDQLWFLFSISRAYYAGILDAQKVQNAPNG